MVPSRSRRPRWGGRRGTPARLFALGLLALGWAYLAMFSFPTLPLTLALGVVVGAGVAVYGVGASALLQGSVDGRYLGRVYGALGTAQSLALLIGMGTASGLGTTVGAVPLLDVAGCCSVLAGFVALVLLPGRRRGTAAGLALGGAVG